MMNQGKNARKPFKNQYGFGEQLYEVQQSFSIQTLFFPFKLNTNITNTLYYLKSLNYCALLSQFYKNIFSKYLSVLLLVYKHRTMSGIVFIQTKKIHSF